MDAAIPRPHPRFIKPTCPTCGAVLALAEPEAAEPWYDEWRCPNAACADREAIFWDEPDRLTTSAIVGAAWPYDEPRYHFDETAASIIDRVRYLATVEQRVSRLLHRSPLEQPADEILAELRTMVRDLEVPPQ